MQQEKSAPVGKRGTRNQRLTREGGSRRGQMAEGLVVLMKPGNSGGGKEP
jgi:hypothetical protein